MKADICKLWTDALRSGEYKQGTCTLRDSTRACFFCVLGVLCDLYCKATGRDWEKDEIGPMEFSIFGESQILPAPVVRWAGLKSIDPVLEPDGHSCTELNDGGSGSRKHSFKELADMIDKAQAEGRI